MKFQFLGTAAAEGIPGMFCECATCRAARKNGGKDYRTRSQAIIDGKLLIDFGADTYLHSLLYHLDLPRVEACLITHAHADHLYPNDIAMRQWGYAARKPDAPEKLPFYGSSPVGKKVRGVIGDNCDCNYASFTEVHAFEPFEAAGYTVTPLPGRHDPGAGPLLYVIEKDGKAVFYGHDTGPLYDEIWDWIEKEHKHFDLVTLDCVGGASVLEYDAHSDIWQDRMVKKRMLALGAADENTLFFVNHFAHDARIVLYDELKPIADRCGLLLSHDGLEVEF